MVSPGRTADRNLLFHWYRYSLMRQCELVLTDTPGVEVLARCGIHHARAANLFGLDRAFLDAPPPEGPRDIDILFCGNLHPAVQRQRLPWLARLAALAGRYRVAIRTGVFGADYRALLACARIVFNLSIRGEANLRAFEAAAGGALLFQEATNREVPDYFRKGQDVPLAGAWDGLAIRPTSGWCPLAGAAGLCPDPTSPQREQGDTSPLAGTSGLPEAVYYRDDNLETLLAYYLDHEDERRVIVEAARRRVRDCTFEALWQAAVTTIEESWPEVQERYRQRPEGMGQPCLPARTWQALSSSRGRDLLLGRDLQAALAAAPHAAALHNALGLAVTVEAQGAGPATALLAGQAAVHFRRARESDAGHVLAGLNLVEALVGCGQDAEAKAIARNLLARLEQSPDLPPDVLEAGHFPPGFDPFRVEWEAAAWSNVDDPQAESQAKHRLLRWRLHALLADLTGDLAHYRQATELRPDLPVSQAMLGCALGRAGRVAEAVTPLRLAVERNPFDGAAARALFQALLDTGDRDGQLRLIEQRRLLAQAAPQVVPAEPWFAAPPRNTTTSPLRALGLEDFRRRFGSPDTNRALSGFTRPSIPTWSSPCCCTPARAASSKWARPPGT
jgi:hypothetical protein